jgi:hypothetical protein
VGGVVVKVRRRVLRLLERRGYSPDAEAAPDPLAEGSPVADPAQPPPPSAAHLFADMLA